MKHLLNGVAIAAALASPPRHGASPDDPQGGRPRRAQAAAPAAPAAGAPMAADGVQRLRHKRGAMHRMARRGGGDSTTDQLNARNWPASKVVPQCRRPAWLASLAKCREFRVRVSLRPASIQECRAGLLPSAKRSAPAVESRGAFGPLVDSAPLPAARGMPPIHPLSARPYRRRSCRAISQNASATIVKTTARNMVASALISGSPRCAHSNRPPSARSSPTVPRRSSRRRDRRATG